MANKRISELNYNTQPTLSDLLPIVNSGETKQISLSGLSTIIKPSISTNVTYSDLVNNITGGTLIIGNYYKITDFVTSYDVPDFNVLNQPKPNNAIENYQGNNQPIIVLAVTNNTISDIAYQEEFPNDKIRYDWTWNQTEITNSPAFGRITERIDNNDNRTDYDHRNIRYVRYRSFYKDNQLSGSLFSFNSSTGELTGNNTTFLTHVSIGDVLFFDYGGVQIGVKVLSAISDTHITVLTDSNFSDGGSPMINFSGGSINLFKSTLTNNFYEYKEVYIGQKNEEDFDRFLTFNLNGKALHNYVGDYSNFYLQHNLDNNGFLLANNVFFSNNSMIYSNTIGDRSYNNSACYWFLRNTISGRFYNNVTQRHGFYSNIIGEYFNNNSIYYDFYSNEIGEYFSYNKIYDSFYNNKIKQNFYNNSINGNFYYNNILNDFSSNFIFSVFYNNNIRNNFNSNTGSTIDNINNYSFNTNNIGDDCYSNMFLENVDYNKIDDQFHNNTIQNYFEYNDIGFQFKGNLITNSFAYNKIKEFVGANSFYDSTQNNIIGSYTFNNNFNGILSNNEWSTNFNSNTIDNNFIDNKIGVSFYSNIIASEFRNNNINNYVNNNTISDYSQNNIINSYFQYNGIALSFQNNLIGNSFISNTIGDNNKGNKIGEFFQNNTLGNYCSNNIIANNSNSNNISDYFNNNTINEYFKNNTIASYFTDNKINDYFSGNTISYYFTDNEINNYYNNNSIGSNFKFNKIGSYFSGNTILDNFGYDGSNTQGNIIQNSFKNNVIGNNFLNNNVCDNFINNNINNNFKSNKINTDINNINFIVKSHSITGFTYSDYGSTATNGTYNNITGTTYTNNGGIINPGIGNGAIFSVTVSRRRVSNVTITNNGKDYTTNDYILVPGTSIGGISTSDDLYIGVSGIDNIQIPVIYQPFYKNIATNSANEKKVYYYDISGNTKSNYIYFDGAYNIITSQVISSFPVNNVGCKVICNGYQIGADKITGVNTSNNIQELADVFNSSSQTNNLGFWFNNNDGSVSLYMDSNYRKSICAVNDSLTIMILY